MKQYTVEQFDDLIFKGFQYTLPPQVLTDIVNLEKWLKQSSQSASAAAAATDGAAGNRRRAPNSNGGGGGGGSGGGGNIKRDVTWRAPNHATEPFKATQFIAKEKTSREEFLQQIRLYLNKISANNFDALNETMMTAISDQWGEGSENIDEFAPLVQPLLDIASMNKFYAEIYARLFRAWSARFPMSHILDSFCDEQHRALGTSGEGYADERKDPEKYYAYGKMNDKRRANTVFWVHLWKCGVIPIETLLEQLSQYHDWLLSWMDEQGRGPAVEELADNMCLAVGICKTEVASHAMWIDHVLPKIQKIAQSKSKDHLSLPSRIVFKYKDLL